MIFDAVALLQSRFPIGSKMLVRPRKPRESHRPNCFDINDVNFFLRQRTREWWAEFVGTQIVLRRTGLTDCAECGNAGCVVCRKASGLR